MGLLLFFAKLQLAVVYGLELTLYRLRLPAVHPIDWDNANVQSRFYLTRIRTWNGLFILLCLLIFMLVHSPGPATRNWFWVDSGCQFINSKARATAWS